MTEIPEFDRSIHASLDEWSILLMYRGSVAHGMYVPNTDPSSIDDIDLMGFCVPPIDHYFGMAEFGSRGTVEIVDDPWDVVIYEARKAIGMLAQGNPNVISMLWLDETHYLNVTDAGRLLLDNRHLFIGKHVHKSFGGYAADQLKKLDNMVFEGYMADKRRLLYEKHGYDPKNAAHLIRLQRMGTEFLRTGEMEVNRSDAEELLSIKRGEWPLDEVRALSTRQSEDAERAFEESDLPEGPDLAKINDLCVEVIDLALKRTT